MRDIYLETNKFYTIPSYKEYHLAKTAHIKANHPQYDTIQTNEKWNLLITELMSSLEQKHIPSGMQASEFKTRLAGFKTRRETTADSPTNLSLKQLVNYFEEFNFLYKTTNALYKLTDAAKKDLLESISEGMGVCETGLNGRLYTALQVHQKESDWIQNELVKARCATLRLLHTAYGGTNPHSVHTYNTLVQLANDAQLGIPQKEEVVDAYASIVDFPAVQTFFNAQYPSMFASYENDIEDCLTNHYLSEFSSFLGIDNVAWANHTITMDFRKTQDITLSIKTYFEGVAAEDNILRVLGGDDEGNDLNYVLNSRQDVAKEIKSLVRKKLITEQYLVSLDQIEEDPTLRQHLRLKNGIELDDLIKLYKALKNGELQPILDSLEQNPLMLLSYPELISGICSNGAILSTIPRWLRCDTRFIDASMTALDQLLCEAINENNAEAIENLTEQVLYLIRTEYGYLETLSPPVFANRLVAEKLIKKNSLLFGYLDTSLQADFALLEKAVFPPFFDEYDDHLFWIDKIALEYSTIYQMLPEDFRGSYDLYFLEGTIYRQTMDDFLKVQALVTLLTHSKINISTFLEHVNCLSPEQLLDVIRYRNEKQLPPLPFFDNHQDLEQFSQELSNQLGDVDWSADYLSIKRKACETENFKFMRDPWALKNAVTFLSKTDGWFAGFNQYQRYQTSSERLWAILMEIMRVLLKLFKSIVKIGLSIASAYYLIPFVSELISIFFWPVLKIELSLWLLGCFIESPLLKTIFCFMFAVIFFDIELYIQAVKITLSESWLCITTVLDNVSLFTALLDVISRPFSYFTNKNEHLGETLEETCENIVMRLDGINEVSAQGKAEVLRELLTQIKTDEEGTFKERLCKKYPISYQGHTPQVSFQEIASIRRGHHSEFKLSERPEGRGFFSRRTTTETLLETVEASLSLAL